MSKNFVIRDSGKRAKFAGGMVRDVTQGKIQYHRLFHGVLMERLCTHFTNGAIKYPDSANGEPNWMLANDQVALNRFKESAARHFAQWMLGDRSEDHFAATVFNQNAWEWLNAKLHPDEKMRKCNHAKARNTAG